jgi:hypothetical protein
MKSPFDTDTKDLTKAQVHRLDRRIAISLDGQPTVYLTIGQAKGLASAIKACAKDVEKIPSSTNSKFSTFRIEP